MVVGSSTSHSGDNSSLSGNTTEAGSPQASSASPSSSSKSVSSISSSQNFSPSLPYPGFGGGAIASFQGVNTNTDTNTNASNTNTGNSSPVSNGGNGSGGSGGDGNGSGSVPISQSSSSAAPADISPPNAPIIVSPHDFSQPFTSADIVFLGTAEPQSVISNDFNISTTTADSNGNWLLNLSLNQGSTTIKFFATDASGNISSSANVSLFIDSAPHSSPKEPLPPSDTAPAVVTNEIAWMGTTADYRDEWIELKSDADVNLNGWVLTIEGKKDIPLSGFIPAGGFFVVRRPDEANPSDIPTDLFISFGTGLSNSGETLILKNSFGIEVDRVDGNDNWKIGGEEIIGDNTTKETAQRIGSIWMTALATPKAVNFSSSEPQPPPPDTVPPDISLTAPANGDHCFRFSGYCFRSMLPIMSEWLAFNSSWMNRILVLKIPVLLTPLFGIVPLLQTVLMK